MGVQRHARVRDSRNGVYFRSAHAGRCAVEPRNQRSTCTANASQAVFEVARDEIMPRLLGDDAVFVCDVKSNGGDDRAWYFAGLPHEMKLPMASLHITQKKRRNTRVGERFKTDHYARVVTLENNVDFADNYFDLLPGETRVPSNGPVRSVPQTEPSRRDVLEPVRIRRTSFKRDDLEGGNVESYAAILMHSNVWIVRSITGRRWKPNEPATTF